jgi:hypothetical protein
MKRCFIILSFILLASGQAINQENPIQLFNYGKLQFQIDERYLNSIKDIHIDGPVSKTIDKNFLIPVSLPAGAYSVRVNTKYFNQSIQFNVDYYQCRNISKNFTVRENETTTMYLDSGIRVNMRPEFFEKLNRINFFCSTDPEMRGYELFVVYPENMKYILFPPGDYPICTVFEVHGSMWSDYVLNEGLTSVRPGRATDLNYLTGIKIYSSAPFKSTNFAICLLGGEKSPKYHMRTQLYNEPVYWFANPGRYRIAVNQKPVPRQGWYEDSQREYLATQVEVDSSGIAEVNINSGIELQPGGDFYELLRIIHIEPTTGWGESVTFDSGEKLVYLPTGVYKVTFTFYVDDFGIKRNRSEKTIELTIMQEEVKKIVL